MTNQTTISTNGLNGKKPKVIGCDDGHAAIKLAYFVKHSDGRLEIRTHAVPSRATRGRLGDIKGRRQDAYETVADGEPGTDDRVAYTVTPLVKGDDTRVNNYQYSALNRVLVSHTLRSVGLGGLDLHLIAGLPPGSYFKGTEVNEEMIALKRASLSKPVEPLFDGAQMPRMVNVDVFPEAVAALVDYLYDDNGSPVNAVTGNVAVVDIGGRTTDVVVLLPSMQIDHSRSGSEMNLGVLHLISRLNESISQHFGLSESLDERRVEEALTTGRIRIFGNEEDVSAIVDHCRNEVADQIWRSVQRRIGQGANMDRILFVGGGAEVMRSVITQYSRNGVVAPHPQFANARGFLKAELIK